MLLPWDLFYDVAIFICQLWLGSSEFIYRAWKIFFKNGSLVLLASCCWWLEGVLGYSKCGVLHRTGKASWKTERPDSEQRIQEHRSFSVLYDLVFKVTVSLPTTAYWLYRAVLVSMGEDCMDVWIQRDKEYWGLSWKIATKNVELDSHVALEIKEFLVSFQEHWHQNSEKKKKKATTERTWRELVH